MTPSELLCLQCRTCDPMDESAAVAAIKEQDGITPGLLAYYPCVNGGYHLTIAGARDDARRPAQLERL